MAVIARPYVASPARHRSSILTWAVLWLSGPLAAALVLLLLWTIRFEGRFFPGVAVGQVTISTMRPAEARAALQQAYAHPAAPPLEVTLEGRTWLLDTRTLGATYTFDDALDAAYKVGRRGTQWEQWERQFRVALEGVRFPVSTQVDEGAARLWLNTLAAKVYTPLREPTVTLGKRGVLYTPGQPGREVDIPATWERLRQALDQLQEGALPPEPIPLVIRQTGPEPLDVSALQAGVERMTRPLRVRAGDVLFALDPADVSQVVTLTPTRAPDGTVDVRVTVNRELLRQKVATIAARYHRDPVNARLDYDPATDRFIVLAPSVNGWDLDVDAAVDAIARALEEGRDEVTVPAYVVRPAVPMDATPQELGIREVVGEGTTYFLGSSPARVRNIVRAAEAVRGVVIPPGEVFSFNEAAGAITAANGYEDSLIIWGDRTAVGIGGGVCQVSTTLYRAAFFGGMPIVERWNHGYIVSWYGEPGLDATVYSPYVDFKFRNATDAYLLVQPIVDTERGVLTFRLWGTAPGWEVEVSEPIQEDVQDPPPPVYQEDPTLPAGTIRQVEWPKPGMTVRITRTVRRGDTIIEQREFISRYQPWRAIYLYGPGTEIPNP